MYEDKAEWKFFFSSYDNFPKIKYMDIYVLRALVIRYCGDTANLDELRSAIWSSTNIAQYTQYTHKHTHTKRARTFVYVCALLYKEPSCDKHFCSKIYEWITCSYQWNIE